MGYPRARSRRILRGLAAGCAAFGTVGTVAAQAAAAPAPAAETAPEAAPSALPPVEKDLPPEYPGGGARANHLIAGAATAVAWYGVGVGTSLLWSDAPGADELMIPVAGPWLSLAETGCPAEEPDCSTALVVFQAILTTLSGVGQIGGLAVFGEGLFLPGPSSTASSPAKKHGVSARLQPLNHGRSGLGLGIVGTF